jgi:hypothetical protein
VQPCQKEISVTEDAERLFVLTGVRRVLGRFSVDDAD